MMERHYHGVLYFSEELSPEMAEELRYGSYNSKRKVEALCKRINISPDNFESIFHKPTPRVLFGWDIFHGIYE